MANSSEPKKQPGLFSWRGHKGMFFGALLAYAWVAYQFMPTSDTTAAELGAQAMNVLFWGLLGTIALVIGIVRWSRKK